MVIDIVQSFHQLVTSYSSTISIALSIVSVGATICIYLFSVKQSNNSQKEIKQIIQAHKDELIAFHDRQHKQQEAFHIDRQQDMERFHKQLTFDQHRPRLHMHPYTLDVDVSRRGLPVGGSNIYIGYDYATDDKVSDVYTYKRTVDDPHYYLELSNHGVHKALQVSIMGKVKFKNNVLTDILDACDDLTFSDYPSDIGNTGRDAIERLFADFRGDPINRTVHLGLFDRIEDAPRIIARDETVRFTLPEQFFLLQQVLSVIDLRTLTSKRSDDREPKHLIDDVVFEFDVIYKDVNGVRYIDTFELASYANRTGHDIVTGSRSDNCIQYTLYPQKTQHGYNVEQMILSKEVDNPWF